MFKNFKLWFTKSVMSEAIMRFSQKYPGKNVNEVPAGFWQWLIDTMGKQPSWTPAIEGDDGKMLNKQQVLSLAQMRSQNKRYGSSASAPTSASAQPKPTPATKPSWVLAKVLNITGLNSGDFVVATQHGGHWVVMSKDSKTVNVSQADIAKSIESIKQDNKPITSHNPEELWAHARAMTPEDKKDDSTGVGSGKNPHILTPDQLNSDGNSEGEEVDKKFEQLMHNPKQSHIMINALAGAGKTTMLKHLAWKYGKQGQRWLYIVFNTKNKVEAEETKDGWRKFPPWVQVYTTNSFLGHVLGHKNNLSKIPYTERIAKLAERKTGDDNGVKKLEKARIIADGPDFMKKLPEYGIPNDVDHIMRNQVPQQLRKLGLEGSSQYYEGALKTIFGGIQKQFKERALTLLGLLKSFGVNPHKKDELDKEIKRVFDKYDVADHGDDKKESGFFDTSLEDIKERMAKYKSSFGANVRAIVRNILGYDFMTKNYRDEVISAAKWMLHETLPQATSQTYTIGKDDAAVEHNLGDYRDFNDDLWYAAIHADDLHWDHYDFVLADEVQDFNEGQMIMLKKLHDAGAKIVAVGDPNQCVISGTLVDTPSGKIAIENISIGDQIIAASGAGKLTEQEVNDVFCREVENIEVVKITTESGKTIISTPEHTHFAGFNTTEKTNNWYVYLMRRDEDYRIGITQNFRLRVNGERADALWLLGTYNDESEARFYEHFYSIKYCIPTWVFISEGRNIKYTKRDIQRMFSSVNTKKSAHLLAEELNINLDRPHYTPKCMSSKRPRNFVITLCADQRFQPLHGYSISGSNSNDETILREEGLNVRPGKHGVGWKVESSHANVGDIYSILDKVRNVMDVNVIEKARFTKKSIPFCTASNVLKGMKIFVKNDNQVCIEEVVSVKRINYTGKVYDLNVNRVHNFIANDIITHNSIYRFRGADNDAFDKLSKTLGELSGDKDWKPNALSRNFRSRKAVLDFVNDKTHVKNLKQGKKFKDGNDGTVTDKKVKYVEAFDALKQEKQNGKIKQTAFIARTNEPLVHAALKLLANGIPFAIVGRDVAGDLLKHINWTIKTRKMTDQHEVSQLRNMLVAHEQDEINKHGTKATKHHYLAELKDTTLALTASIDQFTNSSSGPKTIGHFKNWLKAQLGGFDVQENEKDLKDFKEKVEKENAVILTTAHKSKGLEFSRVYILRDDQFPHPRAKHPDEKGQEDNAKYVAYTRAMDELHIIDLKGQPGVKD